MSVFINNDAVKARRKGNITATEAISRVEVTRTTFYNPVKAEGLKKAPTPKQKTRCPLFFLEQMLYNAERGT